MNNHFIFDFETIGQDVFKIPVVNCAYYVFDWDRFTSDKPYTFNELVSNIQFAKLDIKSQLAAGCKYNKRDIDWWMSLPPKVQNQLKPSPEDVSVEEFCTIIYNYLKSQPKLFRWWSRANTFDPVIMARLFNESIGRDKMDEVMKFWLVRDTRTYIDTQFDFNPNVKNGFCPIDDEALWAQHFEEHNCIHDLAADIMRLQKIERTIKCD
jgi:hypothetical protein